MYPGCPSPFFCKSAYIMNQSFLEQVSQCQTKTLRDFFCLATWWGFRFPIPSTAIKDMRIGSHCHGHSVMNLHHLLSQQAVKFSLSYAEPMCRKEHPMTRPQKESDMKREHRVTIRLTDTEFSIIENTAEQADMSISEYMRKQIMEGQVNTKVSA